MNNEELLEEKRKCQQSIAYFASKYLFIKTPDGKLIPYPQRAIDQLKEFEEAEKKGIKHGFAFKKRGRL